VWLGAHVVVTDGSTVGRDAIIGAGAVVVGAIPDFAVAVGTPAKVIRDRRQTGVDLAASP
jgi:acetyltransferase-like isoleucine patch superfamily enzyme